MIRHTPTVGGNRGNSTGRLGGRDRESRTLAAPELTQDARGRPPLGRAAWHRSEQGRILRRGCSPGSAWRAIWQPSPLGVRSPAPATSPHRWRVIAIVAAGALGLGGCAGEGGDRATDPSAPPADPSTDLAVTGTNRLRFEPEAFTVPADEEVTLTFAAQGAVEHDFVVDDAADAGTAEGADAAHDGHDDSQAAGGDLHVTHADPGQNTTATFQMDEPGTYTVYCSVPGHRQAGMLATLTVVEAS